MKVHIHIELDGVDDQDDRKLIDRLIQAGPGVAPTVTVGASATDPPVEPVETRIAADEAEEQAAAKRSAAAKKAAATKAENKAGKEAAAKAEAELTGEDPVVPKATEGALKKAVNAGVEAVGVDAVRLEFNKFKAKNGDECMRFTDIQEVDYAAVIAKLQELVKSAK